MGNKDLMGQDWTMLAAENLKDSAAEAAAHLERMTGIIYDCYQIVAALADRAGLFEHPEVQRVLDELSEGGDGKLDTLLPFRIGSNPIKPSKAQEKKRGRPKADPKKPRKAKAS